MLLKKNFQELPRLEEFIAEQCVGVREEYREIVIPIISQIEDETFDDCGIAGTSEVVAATGGNGNDFRRFRKPQAQKYRRNLIYNWN